MRSGLCDPEPFCLMDEAQPRCNATHLERGSIAAHDENGRTPHNARQRPAARGLSLGSKFYTFRKEAVLRVAPQ